MIKLNVLTKLTLSAVLFYFLLLSGESLSAQSGTHSSGGNISGTDGKVSFSVGQVHYVNASSSTGSVGHGVQHPIEIFRYTGLTDHDKQGLNVQIFPNPTSNGLHIQLKDSKHAHYSCQMTTINGQVCAEIDVLSKDTYLDLSTMSKGGYILVVYSNGRAMASYQIFKSQ
ncbi:MAG TPA: T9SS type A sorting domain-containing protein [Luteibaculaceae bacterium]|nr:T9SS type A sorting domain-containing protein [Luteibaculaceae bacterium]